MYVDCWRHTFLVGPVTRNHGLFCRQGTPGVHPRAAGFQNGWIRILSWRVNAVSLLPLGSSRIIWKVALAAGRYRSDTFCLLPQKQEPRRANCPVVQHYNIPVYSTKKRSNVSSRLIDGRESLRNQERPYHVDRTTSRPLCEVKRRRARLVLRWGTTWEALVLFLFFLSNDHGRPRTTRRKPRSCFCFVLFFLCSSQGSWPRTTRGKPWCCCCFFFSYPRANDHMATQNLSPPTYLSVYLPTYLPIYPYTYLPTYLPTSTTKQPHSLSQFTHYVRYSTTK